MPYLTPEARHELIYGNKDPEFPGELNFALTLEAIAYVDRNGKSYRVLNDVLGAFEAAKLEFYRRVVAPYEDDKCEQNGDVY